MNNLSAACLEPYIGLKPFTEQEKDRFFGRAHETNILLNKIRANRLTLLMAASGVGKSSLLQAGIMPEFRADGHAELIYHNSWAAEPGAALRQSIVNHYAKRPGLSGFGGDFTQLSLKDTLLACTLFGSGQQILLLDQFEEFFNYQRFQKGFKTFVEELSAAVLDRSLPACFVFSMREDFALELNAFKPFLPGVFDSYFRLEKLTRDQARLAIEQPLQQIGWSFAPKQDSKEGLLEQVLDDLAKREQERQFGVQELLALQELPLLVEPPHLQIVCRELWDNHRDESVKQITHAAYHKAGQAEGILETYFLRKIGQFSKKEQVLASAAFDHLVGQRATKVAHPLERLAELTRADANALKLMLDKLQDCAVLRRQKRGEEFWYELYHDIFSESIDKWNREFKHQQRVKRLTVGTAAVLIAGGLLFAGNNWRANYYGRYLQLSPKESISDRIEVYKGAMAGRDIFHQRLFLYEAPFSRSKIEADKKFDRRIIEDESSSQSDLIATVPLSSRIPLYMEAGLYTKGCELADSILHDNKAEDISSLPKHFAQVRTTDSVALLSRALEKQSGAELKKAVVAAFAGLNAVSEIVKLLTDINSDVRSAAVSVLGQLKADTAAPEIVKRLSDSNWQVRSAAVSVLGQLKADTAAPEVVKLLTDSESGVRSAAALALGQMKADTVVPEIVKLLTDSDWEVRSAAALALGQLKAYKAALEIVKLLTDANPYVRTAASLALVQLKTDTAVQEIIKLLVYVYRSDSSVDFVVQCEAASTLGQMKAYTAAPEIVKLLEDSNWHVRSTAASVLGQMKAHTAVPEIVKLLTDSDSDDVRLQAALALARMNHSSPQLQAWRKLAFKDAQEKIAANNADERKKAAQLLAPVFTEQAATLLAQLMGDADQDVAQEAVKAIGFAAEFHPEWIPKDKLLALLKHPDLDMRETAVTSLGQLIAFRGEKKAADPPELDQRVRNALFSLIKDPQQKTSTRLSAIDALGDTGWEECAQFLDRSKEEAAALHSRCLFWLGRMNYAYAPTAYKYVEEELRKLEQDKWEWRKQRDQDNDADKKTLDDDAWWQVREYRLGSALARIAPAERGIELLGHPLHYVRQGAVRALAGKADADLIGKIIQAHQDFDPDELPSPFPYTTFQAIDLALWNLEYTGTAADLAKLKDILAKLKPCRVPGQEGAIKERLDWTIERLQSKTAGHEKQHAGVL